MKLVRYDTARRALEAARSVDEVKAIRNQAEAMRAYARQADDKKLLADSLEIKRRAERELGRLMDAQAKTIGKAGGERGGRPPKNSRPATPRVFEKPTLIEAGISNNLAKRARTAYALPKPEFEKQLVELREEVLSTATRRIAQAGKAQRRTDRERDLAEHQRALPDRRYGVIVADPEWQFEPWSRDTGMDRAADNHYPTSTWQTIKERDVPSIAARDAVLFLWATVPMLPQALEVMLAWRFRYTSHIVWVKDRIGTGYWFRNQHELLLVGTRGDIPAPTPGTQSPSIIEAPLGRHSAKPEVFLELIERHFPTLPKIELNRRGAPREGWDAWGNESQKEIA